MLVGIGGREDETRCAGTERGHLRGDRLRMVDHMDGELLPLERDIRLQLHPEELKVLVRQGLAAQNDETERREPAA